MARQKLACAAWHPETPYCPHIVGWHHHVKAAMLAACRERALRFLKEEGEHAIQRALSLMQGGGRK